MIKFRNDLIKLTVLGLSNCKSIGVHQNQQSQAQNESENGNPDENGGIQEKNLIDLSHFFMDFQARPSIQYTAEPQKKHADLDIWIVLLLSQKCNLEWEGLLELCKTMLC